MGRVETKHENKIKIRGVRKKHKVSSDQAMGSK